MTDLKKKKKQKTASWLTENLSNQKKKKDNSFFPPEKKKIDSFSVAGIDFRCNGNKKKKWTKEDACGDENAWIVKPTSAVLSASDSRNA